MVNDRLDELLKEVEKRKKTKDVQMSLDYVPSWITGAKTLLEKINRCVEKLDGKQDELSTTQLFAVNSGITQAKVEHYDAIPIVVGNPTESGSVNLTKLKIGDTVYNTSLFSLNEPIIHANIWRGKNLGSVVTDEQKYAIGSGTFKDLFIGDYWEINNRKWRIADMDYFYNVGDIALKKHHLVIIPDQYLYLAVMNDTSSTSGGYAGSKMRTAGLDDAKNIINSAFGDLVVTHRDFFTNAVTDGRPSGGAWFDSTVELMNEIMVYGCHIRAAMGTGAIVPTNYTTAKKQLSIFRLNTTLLNQKAGLWLRDIVSSNQFAHVSYSGAASAEIADHPEYIYPYFVIG